MAKSKKKRTEDNDRPTPPDNWISMRGGLRTIAVVSIALAAWTAYQSAPNVGWAEGIFWGFVFGAGVWAVFLGALALNRWFRG